MATSLHYSRPSREHVAQFQHCWLRIGPSTAITEVVPYLQGMALGIGLAPDCTIVVDTSTVGLAQLTRSNSLPTIIKAYKGIYANLQRNVWRTIIIVQSSLEIGRAHV